MLFRRCAGSQHYSRVRCAPNRRGCRSGSVIGDARSRHHRRSRPRRAGIARRARGCRDRGRPRDRGGGRRGARTANDRRRGALRRAGVRRRARALRRGADDGGPAAVQAAPGRDDRGRGQLRVLRGSAGRHVRRLRRGGVGRPASRRGGRSRNLRRLPGPRRGSRADEQHRAARRPRDPSTDRQRHAPGALGRRARHHVRAGGRGVPCRGGRALDRLDLRPGDVRGDRRDRGARADRGQVAAPVRHPHARRGRAAGRGARRGDRHRSSLRRARADLALQSVRSGEQGEELAAARDAPPRARRRDRCPRRPIPVHRELDVPGDAPPGGGVRGRRRGAPGAVRRSGDAPRAGADRDVGPDDGRRHRDHAHADATAIGRTVAEVAPRVRSIRSPPYAR